jgi:hypothetical protein
MVWYILAHVLLLDTWLFLPSVALVIWSDDRVQVMIVQVMIIVRGSLASATAHEECMGWRQFDCCIIAVMKGESQHVLPPLLPLPATFAAFRKGS